MKVYLAKLGLVAAALLFAGYVALPATAQTSANVFAVTSTNQLVRFRTATPGTVTTIGPVTGLQAGENILGIDFRPATGDLYALGSTGRLYIINRATAAASLVAPISVSLSGTTFGFDFNAMVDRIRVVSNTGQNLRLNPTNGVAIVDNVLNGATTGASAAAYTNGFNGATTTTLYDISGTTDQLFTQNPPNGGTLILVGSLGVDATDVNGFDILLSDNTAYAAMTVGGTSGLYTVNLSNGAATLIGAIGTGAIPYSGFAIDIGMKSNYIVYGVTTSNNLVRFNSVRPNTILDSVPITGLQAGENVLGIDFRPQTGELFALGSTSRLYRVNTSTGAATQVGSAGSFTLSGTSFGFDFNPTVDRIRVTSDTDQNIRLNPNDGSLTAADAPLAYAAGDPNAGQNPNVIGSAYTNAFAGATSTTLYDIDSNVDILATQLPPNNGTLNTVGPLGLNVTGEVGFDIAVGSNVAFAAFQLTGGGTSTLYSINLTAGSAAPIGPIGGLTIRDIAVGRSTASNASTATIDFDGDGRTDYAVFRGSTGEWFIHRSSNGSYYTIPFGLNTDILTPGDYDGDGRTDVAVWRASSGTFYVQRSSDGGVTFFQWGVSGDKPVARDYDGDGKTDFAVVRQQAGALVWYIQNSATATIRIEQFGFDTDRTVPGDYDGDGRFDPAIYRSGVQATFHVLGSTSGYTVTGWGLSADLTVPGDYDGDSKTDFAVVRPLPQFAWYVLRSSDLSLFGDVFGISPQLPTVGDYDGDGKTDLSTWSGSNGAFYVLRTASPGVTTQFQFGASADSPVANSN
jgi:hypothetical protein